VVLTILGELCGDLQPFFIAAVGESKEDTSTNARHEAQDAVIWLDRHPFV
jgi:hypothetical protein